MPDYEKMYHLLFNAITDALTQLEAQNYPYHETSLCTSSTTYTGNPQKPLFVSSSTPCHQ